MAFLQLLKLASQPLPRITTSNANYEYFRQPTTYSIDVAATASYSLKLTQWAYGNGNAITGFITGTAGYAMNINGVLQQSSLYRINATKVTLIAPAATAIHIPKNAPITLETYKAATIVSTARTYAVP